MTTRRTSGAIGGMFAHRSATSGRAFSKGRKRTEDSQLTRFAELLSEHTDEADIASGRGHTLDPGGDTRITARRMGLDATRGNGLLQRLRRDLGPQAK